jgi:hypothetical chaperone protein
MGNFSCGIDFGTSNSSVAIASEGKIELVPLEGSQVTMPSAIFFPIGGTPVFGRKAVQQFVDRRDGRFMRSLKRVLGTPLMKQGTMINGKPWKFENIIGSFLSNLRSITNTSAKRIVENVVIGRPVHFVDHNRDADKNAQAELYAVASAVGYKNIEFQFEPIAAAFAHEVNVTGEKLAIVADLGGGTSDFTVIRLSKNYVGKADRLSDILASTGVRVGGNDFDKNLCLGAFMPELGYRSTYGKKNLEVPLKYYHDLAEWSKVNFLYTPKILSHIRQLLNESHDPTRFRRLLRILEQETGHSLLSAAERAKIALTDSSECKTDMEFFEERFSIQTTREAFEFLIAGDVEKISSSARECLLNAGVKAAQIQLVILTGGSTEIPLVQSAFRKLFPAATFTDENKLSSVGLGLAYDSDRKFR